MYPGSPTAYGEGDSVASATPTGQNTVLTRAIAGLSVIVALIGVIAVFTKGSGGSSSSGTPTSAATTPAASPSASVSPTPSASASPRATSTPSGHPTRTGQPAGGASTGVASQPPAPVAPAPTTSHPHTSPATGGHPVGLFAPRPGSYQYATTGGEQTNIPGTGRHYPATTTITIRKAGCGVNQTWTPISQHSETQHLCILNNAVHLLSYRTTISFFGRSISQMFTCDNNAVIYSPTFKVGHTWSFTCASNGSKVTQHLKVIEFKKIDVNGTPVRTLHVHASSSISGTNSGSSKQDYWIETGSHPFLIRNTAQISARMGGITYSESYAIQLKRL
jgi:hypothetical protein